MDTLLFSIKRSLGLSLRMLLNEIEACPDSLWSAKAGGYVFWQQALHALAGLKYWTRPAEGEYAEPFLDRNAYPELERDPECAITKDELRELGSEVAQGMERLFEGKDDRWLAELSPLWPEARNLDIILTQVRHLQYHVGHCDSALRERGVKQAEWLE